MGRIAIMGPPPSRGFAQVLSYEPLVAVRFSHWRLPMNDEIHAMERKNTWEVLPLLIRYHAIGKIQV